MQTAYLNEIAEIRTGYSFRKAAQLKESSGLLGLQISDLRGMKVVDPSRLAPIEWPGRGSPPVLQHGDVVIAAKGSENYASVFLGQDQNIVPSSQLLVLSVIDIKRLLPEFLCWLLNYPETLHKLSELQAGTKIYSMSKKALQQLKLPIPDRDAQESILHLSQLFEEEKRLTQALLNNREVMVYGLSKKLLYGEII
ncbi:putative Restriction modification system DNA specificity domain-containing protein [Halomonas sp. A3H3]|uniref:restriction endonuclease subunit S n=1 Tax=Halomonas sp. A3H3 TaxID=1346287 RepID=UPI00038CB67D|nr:restriction endonuclease subunit S [Halomonas sp. A3H3]CDG52295.1 putative Restriction modification system DNA specificity domain-containing protein [Halomonas sp. A3H3]